MSLKLNPNEACKYGSTCPYNNQTGHNFCIGANPNRPGVFICDLVSESGVFTEGKFRSQHDETGKMKVIVENNNV
jgi:hypothetical protein